MPTYTAFVDFEKAFDKVDHMKLWSILHSNGYPRHLMEFVKILYNGRTILLKEWSVEHKIIINQGVWQGCSLSPTLFNIYFDDAIKNRQSKYPNNKGITWDKVCMWICCCSIFAQHVSKHDEHLRSLSIIAIERTLSKKRGT